MQITYHLWRTGNTHLTRTQILKYPATAGLSYNPNYPTMPKNKTKTKKPKMAINALRLPRAKGLTQLIHGIHRQYGTDDPQLPIRLKQVKKLIIEQWIHSSYRLNGVTTSIDELSVYLNLTRERLQKYINKATLDIALMFEKDNGGIREQARVQFLQSLKLASETMALTIQQSQILLAQQGDKYVPFLTRDLNGAIANQIAATKPTMELLKMLQDKSPTLIIPQVIGDGTSTTKNYMSTDQATKMIREHSHSLLETPEYLAEMLPKSLPDIHPNTQNLAQIQVPVVLSDKVPKRKLSQYNHGNRAKEGHVQDIDADEEDFKA